MSLDTLEPTDEHQQDPTTVARMAAARARALRTQARSLDTRALRPLQAALLMRAGELDLTAAVLGEPDTEPAPTPLQAIA